MNDTIYHDGKGGWETESFKKIDYGNLKNDGFRFTTGGMLSKMLGILKKETKPTHFLDTPAGRDWDNIVEWKKVQKANKTNK